MTWTPASVAGLFFILFGLGLCVGPMLFYTSDKRHTLERTDVEEFMDDAAKKRATILFVIGGLGFLAAGLALLFLMK